MAPIDRLNAETNAPTTLQRTTLAVIQDLRLLNDVSPGLIPIKIEGSDDLSLAITAPIFIHPHNYSSTSFQSFGRSPQGFGRPLPLSSLASTTSPVAA